jgi:hypothetical protein
MSELDPQSHRLNPADADALDALIESGLRLPGTSDQRARRVAELMALLDTPVVGEADRESRVLVTEVRTRRHAAPQGLVTADAAALDHWMDHGVSDAPASLRDRVRRQEDLATLGASGPAIAVSDRNSLVDRTMAAVNAQSASTDRRMKFENAPAPRGGWKFRMADLVSVAAMLLIGASVAIPAFEAVGRQQQTLACMGNMQTTSRAFGTYAGSNADMLPMATAGFGGSWLDVGTKDRSNSANLYTLVRTDHARLDDLACPGNPLAPRGTAAPEAWDWKSIDEISYSYRIMGGRGLRMTVAVPSTTQVVVAADRSPVTLLAVRGIPVVPEYNSPNHGGRGQHTLRLDGSTTWENTPVIDGDNMWLPRAIEDVIRHVRSQAGIIHGNEMPASETDAFVGP